jgi:hypothetical protein
MGSTVSIPFDRTDLSAVRKLLLPVAHVIPPPLAGDLDMVVIFSIEDQPRKQMDGDTYAKCKAMADAGEGECLSRFS